MYHISPDGPKPCSAKPGNCLYEVHFETYDEALEYSNRNKIITSPLLKVKPEVLKYSYLGAKVDNDVVKPFITKLLSIDEEMLKYIDNQKIRDNNEYHVTILAPKEFRKLKKQGINIEDLGLPDLSLKGIGTVIDGENQAWFVVAESKKINAWRDELGLDPKDLHVTLGFKYKDIHNIRKDDKTLI